MRSTTLAWILVIVLALASAYFGLKWYYTNVRLQTALTHIDDITTIPENIDSFTSVVFVKADGATITYRTPRADKVGDQTFINYDEHTATYKPSQVQFAGALAGSAADALLTLPEGTNISILFSADGTQVYEIYIPAQK